MLLQLINSFVAGRFLFLLYCRLLSLIKVATIGTSASGAWILYKEALSDAAPAATKTRKYSTDGVN
jgi:hypothetical protein